MAVDTKLATAADASNNDRQQLPKSILVARIDGGGGGDARGGDTRGEDAKPSKQQQNQHHLMSSMVQAQQWMRRQHNREPVTTAAIEPATLANRFNTAAVENGSCLGSDAIGGAAECFGTIAWRGLELGQKLGEGTFGVVYSATYHDYPVAVKIVHEFLTDDAIKREKLMFESRLLSMLRHPNVLLLLGTSITPDSRPVIVTEYCSQGTLKEVMAVTTSVLRRLQFARDIINGINWLHAHNVVHRDLKPVNVLIDEHYRAKVADFGLSLVWHEGIVCTGFKGNIKYSANEVLAARADPTCRQFPYGPQTDVYSFGLMLWELVTNEPLFPEFKDMTAKAAKLAISKFVCQGHRPPLSGGWPRSLHAMLSSCWHADPTQRPKIGAVLRNFQQVLVDLICPDKIGRRVARALWLGEETRRVPYDEFERQFTELTQVDLSTASFCFRRCLATMLCDTFDNTVTFERFCNMLHYFDSLTPIGEFWNRLVTLFDQPWFFGFVPAEDTRTMLIEHWRQTKQGYYLMRFSSREPGLYSLYAIDIHGTLTHWRIGHLYSSEFFIQIDEGGAPKTSFPDLLSLHAHCLQLPSMLRGKKPLPGSPCQCFFASNPLQATSSIDHN